MVHFTTEDLAQFSQASHDHNPLHISKEYARATPYGEPVVFGMLGVLAALGSLRDRDDQFLQNIAIEFRNPLSLEVPYRLDVLETRTDRAVVKLYDDGRLMMKATFVFLPGSGDRRPISIPPVASSVEPADRTKEDLLPGTRVTGSYWPSSAAFAQVIARWRLSRKGATATQIAAMMWSSFVVGMELPGKRAIFWRLALDFHLEAGLQREPFSYEVTVHDLDERFDLLHNQGTLSSGEKLCATAQMWAFVRQDSPKSSLHRITDLLPASERLKGKVALVIGGSRGLGAAITQALASQGCVVLLNYHQCTAEAEEVRASARETCGEIELVQGDAADVEWCRRMRQSIGEQYGGLDVLVCNASPPIRPLTFAPEKLPQLQTFLARSIGLVSAPLSTFLSALADRSGWSVVISSAFVKDLPADWPHYVTAKCAIEGLVRWTAAHHPKIHSLLIRPPRLFTDQTNTALGRQGTMAVEQAAASIVRQLCRDESSPALQTLDTF
jgi:NAD(P)-dependent dehydrogenase (short-subunit alcohol dehydrogenase family)